VKRRPEIQLTHAPLRTAGMPSTNRALVRRNSATAAARSRFSVAPCSDLTARLSSSSGPAVNLALSVLLVTLASITIIAHGPVLAEAHPNEATSELASEVRSKGWIVYSARTRSGDWDLFLMRPDGSQRRNITSTPDANEAAARFSHDGRRLLFRRLPRNSTIDHCFHGRQGSLVLANSDGSSPTVFGSAGQYPWASWGPDGKQLACLTVKGIEVVDIATKKVVRRVPRKGIFQRFFWSTDGKWFVGTANGFGDKWTVVRMNAATGEVNKIHQSHCCTPSWFSDSNRVIYSYRAKTPGRYGETELWMASGDGTNRQLIYGSDDRHMYYGTVSPDLKYVVFTDSPRDGAGTDKNGSPLVVMRLSDAPTIAGKSPALRKRSPRDQAGPVLRLSAGWNPHWTFASVGDRP